MPQQSDTDKWLKGVWGSSETYVFAVGYAGTILNYDGFTWSDMEYESTVNLRGVWGADNDEVFAVGNSGTIIYYNGESWSDKTSGTDADLYGVWEVRKIMFMLLVYREQYFTMGTLRLRRSAFLKISMETTLFK